VKAPLPQPTSSHRKPVEESFTGEPAPLPHVSFVGGPVVEADLVGHRQCFPLGGLPAKIGGVNARPFSLIRRVRALPPGGGGETPAAALTAYTRDEDRVRALDSGFQLHVSKPADPEEVTNVIARLAR